MLAVLTLLTSCIVAIPAAAADGDATANLHEVATQHALEANFADAETKVQDEIALGYTYLYAQNEQFSLYANKYTGEVYLKNRYTGQYLTTNPTDVSKAQNLVRPEMLSQVWISYSKIGSETTPTSINSFDQAAKKGQIAISKIKNGIRVEYTMGDTVSHYAIPEVLLDEDFLGTIVIPLQTRILELFEYDNLAVNFSSFLTTSNISSLKTACQYKGTIGDVEAFKKYNTRLLTTLGGTFANAYEKAYKKAYDGTAMAILDQALYDAMLVDLKQAGLIAEHETELPSARYFRYTLIVKLSGDYETLVGSYKKFDPNTTEFDSKLDIYPALGQVDPETGKRPIIWELDPDISKTVAQKVNRQNILTSYVTGYTVDDAIAQEQKVGFKGVAEQSVVFRCAIEYVLDEDGMTYKLPANSISFDESKYRLNSISILKYFSANDRSEEGYLFFPDGSGALIDNQDIPATATVIGQLMYGYDYAYSTVGDVASRTQSVRLPVYGAVNTDADNGVTTGYFAIITEGDALVKLSAGPLGSSARLGVYQTYSPFPSDTYTIPGATDAIPIFSDVRYVGDYSTKIVMLLDPTLQQLSVPAGAAATYTASYVEMARYYRNYLINVTETLTELSASDVNAQIPLFIESYGTLKSTEKFLTFPVEVDVALTTFDDVKTMHTELSEAGIGNVKFRLIGFYNGGVEGKYPKKLKLMKEVGGKKGLRRLLSYAEDNAASGIEIILGVDLMYNYKYTGLGGISKKKTTVRSMDNRYASKQMYDTVHQGFFSYFSLCVSADKLTGLFNKFNKKLSKFDITALSLDYMAEDLSSNFSDNSSFDREAAKTYLRSTLESISSKYSKILSTGGNVFALEYLDYLLNAPVDSSRYFFASRTVPFYGMVMHGTLEYAGTPFNETGNPDYEILRAIESGSAMYYVLCYRNTDLMKEDFLLSKHYSANYEIWKEDVIRYYNKLDAAIGDLQTHQLYDHQFLVGERVITDAERADALKKLEDEYFELLLAQHDAILIQKGALVRALISAGKEIEAAVDDAAAQLVYDELAAEIVAGLDGEIAAMIAELRALDSDLTDGTALKQLVDGGDVLLSAGQSLHLTFDRDAILRDMELGFAVSFAQDALEADAILGAAYDRICARLDAFIAANATSSGNIAVETDKVTDYSSKTKLSFFTDSLATDADYKHTDFSLDDGSIVMVTYKKGSEEVRILLNFSIFEVKVEIDGKTVILDKYEFVRLDPRA